MKQERIEWIDIAKAIGIILVIAGHSYNDCGLINWIYSFHMPLFFFLSGLTFTVNDRTITGFIKRKVKSLLIPYLMYSFVYIIFYFVINTFGNGTIDLVKRILGIFISVRNSEYSIGLWFLLILFVAEVALAIIVRAIKNTFILAIVIGSLLFINFLYVNYIGVVLPWGVDTLGVVLFFMYLGYYVSV